MSSSSGDRVISVTTKSGTVYRVPEAAVKHSSTLSDVMELSRESGEPTPLENVDDASMGHVLTWIGEREARSGEDFEKWEKAWIARVKPIEQAALLIVANFLGMQALLIIAARGTADNIRGKSPDEIIEAFEIPREELAEAKRVKRENQ